MSLTPSPEEFLLCVRNRHSAAAGSPPRVEGFNANKYVGFFENAQGSRRRSTMSLGARPALVVVKMPANNGAANAIGVARCMDERAVLLDRERARLPGGNRQVR